MKYRFLSIVCLIVLCIFMQSCIKEELDELDSIRGLKFTGDVALPLFSDELGLKEIYAEYSDLGLIRDEAGKPITLVYSGRDSISERQLISIPQLSSNFNFTVDPLSASAFNAVGFLSLPTTSGQEDFSFGNGEQVKTILVKSGVVNFFMSTTIPHRVKVIFTYPSVTKNGVPLTDSLIIVNNTGGQGIGSKAINMQGYTIDLTDNGSTTNRLKYTVSVEVEKIPGNPDLQGGETISFVQSTDVLQYDYVKGYLGKFPLLQMSEVLNIDLYFASQGGLVEFDDPKVNLQLANGFGMPVTVKINRIYIVTVEDVVLDVILNQFKDTITLPFPQREGDYGIGNYVLDNSNSNIKELLNSKPKKLVLKVDFIANYNNIQTDNFMYDSSSLKARADVELPLDIRVKDYMVELTGAFEFPGTENQDTVVTFDYVNLNSIAYNDLPVGAAIQLYFVNKDSSFNPPLETIVDSLFVQPLQLPASVVDQNGDVLQRSQQSNFTALSLQRYQNLISKKTNAYRMNFLVNTSKTGSSPEPFVRIFSSQKVGLKVGVQARASYKQRF